MNKGNGLNDFVALIFGGLSHPVWLPLVGHFRRSVLAASRSSSTRDTDPPHPHRGPGPDIDPDMVLSNTALHGRIFHGHHRQEDC